MRRRPLNARGFTVLELLIATVVLSIILLIATVAIISIGNLFQKGINQSRIQDDLRSVSDDISQRLKFSGPSTVITNKQPSGSGYGVLCIGTTRYTYVIGKQISDNPTGNQIQHVLWRDTVSDPSQCNSSTPNLTNATPSSGGVELIAPNSRLTAFCIGTYKYDPVTPSTPATCTPATSAPFNITIGTAYGDKDLMTAAPYSTSTVCKSGVGDRFCATAVLSTTVSGRIGYSYGGDGGGGGGGGPSLPNCNQLQDSYVRQNSSLYIASDDNGVFPYYTTTDQKVPGGNHGGATDNAAYNATPSPTRSVKYDYISNLQPPVICLGAQAPATASTNGSIVGQPCAVFSYDLYNVNANNGGIYNPSPWYGDVRAVDKDTTYPTGYAFPNYDPAMTGIISGSNQCEFEHNNGAGAQHGPYGYLDAIGDDDPNNGPSPSLIAPVKTIGPLLAIVLQPNEPSGYDYTLSTAGSWVDNCQIGSYGGCEYPSPTDGPNSICMNITDRAYPFPDTSRRSNQLTSDPYQPWDQPTIIDLIDGKKTNNGCASAGGYTTAKEGYFWNYVLACAPSQPDCQNNIKDTSSGPQPKN